MFVLIEDGRVEVRFRLPAFDEPAEDGDDILCVVRVELRQLHASSRDVYQCEGIEVFS